MKWPLVWRSDYDEACQIVRVLEKSVEYERAALASADARMDDLLGKYHELRLKGGVTPAELPQALPKPARDDVYDAIELQAGHDTQLKRHLMRYAEMRRLEQVPTNDIVNKILHWQSDEDSDDAMIR